MGGDTQFNIVNNWPDGRLLTPVSLGFPGGASGKEPANAGDTTCVQSLGWENPLEEGMATHSGILREFHGQRHPVGYSS